MLFLPCVPNLLPQAPPTRDKPWNPTLPAPCYSPIPNPPHAMLPTIISPQQGYTENLTIHLSIIIISPTLDSFRHEQVHFCNFPNRQLARHGSYNCPRPLIQKHNEYAWSLSNIIRAHNDHYWYQSPIPKRRHQKYLMKMAFISSPISPLLSGLLGGEYCIHSDSCKWPGVDRGRGSGYSI